MTRLRAASSCPARARESCPASAARWRSPSCRMAATPLRSISSWERDESMLTYDLYLESGPQRRKTMVHVPQLLGCIANGPTTEAALTATPDAIRGFRGFFHRHGEPLDPSEPFETRVAAHITEGGWLGNGSPYIALPT